MVKNRMEWGTQVWDSDEMLMHSHWRTKLRQYQFNVNNDRLQAPFSTPSIQFQPSLPFSSFISNISCMSWIQPHLNNIVYDLKLWLDFFSACYLFFIIQEKRSSSAHFSGEKRCPMRELTLKERKRLEQVNWMTFKCSKLVKRWEGVL